MIKPAIFLALLVALATCSPGEPVEITSVDSSGTLAWSNSVPGARYAVEWASSPMGPWSRSWSQLENICPTDSLALVKVPVFFRVVQQEWSVATSSASAPGLGSVESPAATGTADRPTRQVAPPSAPAASAAAEAPEKQRHPAFSPRELWAFYPLDGNARDESGNGHDGILYGADWTADRNGVPGSAIRFDEAQDGFIYFGPVTIAAPLTVSLWFKSTQVNSVWKTLLGWNATDHPYSGVQIATDGYGHLIIRMGDSSTDFTTTATPDGDGQWHWLAISRDRQDMVRIYLDGALQASRHTPVPMGTDHVLFIGKSFRPDSYFLNEHFYGCLDEILIAREAY